ncbi:hypothetical protein BH09SUM1_BH09SUM1_11620 [soil metagenome]
MKKFLIGCGIVALLFTVMAVGLGIYAAMKIKKIGNDYQASAQVIEQSNAKYPYTTTQPMVLEGKRLDQYFTVRTAVVDKVMQNPTVQKIVSAMQGGKTAPVGFGEMVALGTRFGPELLKDFGTALDAQKMSAEEYVAHVKAVYAAIDQGNNDGDADMKQIYDNMDKAIDQLNVQMSKGGQAQNQVSFKGSVAELRNNTKVSVENIKEVAKHKDELMAHPEVSFLELMFMKNMRNHAIAPPPPSFTVGTDPTATGGTEATPTPEEPHIMGNPNTPTQPAPTAPALGPRPVTN